MGQVVGLLDNDPIILKDKGNHERAAARHDFPANKHFATALDPRSGSKLCRDEVQPVPGGQIKRIADQRRTRIERRIHLDLRQQLLSPAGTKNGHEAFSVPNVKPIAGQQKASPDGIVRLVLP